MLTVTKQATDSSWYRTALRYAARYGLGVDVTAAYCKARADGYSKRLSVYWACYESDLCDYSL